MTQARKPTIKNSRRINFFTSIWIIPFIALVISLWLVYQHFSQLGPEIKILFTNSGGLEAGRSVLKYRNVPVGKVTRIEIQQDGAGVMVVARMNKETEAFMNETSRFWIVKPEVGYTGVSGLETLISGSYINIHASKGKELKREFIGLESPYIDINSGEYILLNSKSIGSIRVGTPINYRNIQVGRVEHISLAQDHRSVEVVAFVKKEYINLINITTKFWLQGLADIGVHGNRLDVKLAPVIPYLAFGGITFESKFDKSYDKAEPSYFYRLYENQYDAENKKIGRDIRENHVFSFKYRGKISGLKKGASIQYQGFDIGEVTDVSLSYNSHSHAMEGSILGEIDVSIFSEDNKSGFSNLKDAVEEGLRAKLVSINPLINTLFVDLVFVEDAAPVTLVKNIKGTVFPTSESATSSILDELTVFIANLNKLELDRLVNSASNLMDSSSEPLRESLKALQVGIVEFVKLVEPAKEMLNSIANASDDLSSKGSLKKIPAKLNTAIDELSKTLRSTKKVLNGYKSNSLFGKKLTQMLKEINRTSQESKRLLRKLNKKPNSLLLGN